MIIYPPYIADTIPGFLTTEVKIPFEMNPGVSWNNISGFKLQIKEYNGDSIIATISKVKPSSETNELSFTNFSGSWAPTIGQYYKFQLAYMESNEDTNLTFSSASIGKCVGSNAPQFSYNSTIKNNGGLYTFYFDKGNGNNFIDDLYSYRFQFKKDLLLLEDSGEIFAYKNDNYCKYKLKYEVPEQQQLGTPYRLYLSITTKNGYQKKQGYEIYNSLPELTVSTIDIIFPSEKNDKSTDIDKGQIRIETNYKGNVNNKYFLLERTQDLENYEQLVTFNPTTSARIFKWVDSTIEAGTPYYYSVREINSNGQYLSNRLFVKDNNDEPKSKTCNYEDIFLTDINGKQLCIKFDPKVSSFKDTIQEQKVETIGSRYPYFFRNGQIKYKEIPISGLISYWMDEDFMNDQELGIGRTYSHKPAGQSFNTPNIDTTQCSTNLDGYNFAAERKFKLKVLDWLNDGTPKLFRSPAEGVYVIRLMNVSLSPNDTLGRMIHSFSATGYEVSDHDIETLKKAVLPNNTPITSATRLGWFITCEETAS